MVRLHQNALWVLDAPHSYATRFMPTTPKQPSHPRLWCIRWHRWPLLLLALLQPKRYLVKMRISNFLLILLIGCNPVKQVLRDKAKLDIVAEQVVRMGYCANDTITVTKSDTLVTIDTLVEERVDVYSTNDTVYLEKIKIKYVNKNTLIRDTIKSVVVDMAQIRLLKGDITNLNGRLADAEKKANKYLGWLIFLILCISFVLYLRYKK